MNAELYYESHITIEPVFDETLEEVSNRAKKYGFRVADLLMQKRKSDTPQRSKYDTFMTTRGTNYEDIRSRTLDCVNDLMDLGVKVWRYKIEDTLEDVRFK